MSNEISIRWNKESATIKNSDPHKNVIINLDYDLQNWRADRVFEEKIKETQSFISLGEAYAWALQYLSKG